MKKWISAVTVFFMILSVCFLVSADNLVSNIIPEEELASQKIDLGKKFLVSEAKPEQTDDVGAVLAGDDDDSTMWVASELQGSVLQLDFDKAVSFNMIHIKEDGSNCRKFRVDAWNGSKWVTIYSNDLIEAYHMGVLDDTICSRSIRLTVLNSVDYVKIKDVKVTLQRPLSLDHEFVNIGYLSAVSYDQYEFLPDNLHTFTDIIMHGSCYFDKDGKFLLRDFVSEVATHIDPLSDQADKEVERWISEIKKTLPQGARPRMWFSFLYTGDRAQANGFVEETNRKKFIDTVVTFAKRHDFAGVDIDWEYPQNRTQWDSYELLARELSSAMHAEGKYMAVAHVLGETMSLSGETLNKLDRILIMAYDTVGTGGQHSPFNSQCVNIIKTALHNKGIDREKIVLGIPWYACYGTSLTKQLVWSDIYLKLTYNNDEGDTSVDGGINSWSNYYFNGPYLVRNKIVYALKNQIGGVFCWVSQSDTSYENEGSLARVTKDTLDKFLKKD